MFCGVPSGQPPRWNGDDEFVGELLARLGIREGVAELEDAVEEFRKVGRRRERIRVASCEHAVRIVVEARKDEHTGETERERFERGDR